jgi:hypothetical protein
MATLFPPIIRNGPEFPAMVLEFHFSLAFEQIPRDLEIMFPLRLGDIVMVLVVI